MHIWTEEHLRALDPSEHDFQEFKSSAWVASEQGELHPDLLQALSKQVSAFANGAGGVLLIGVGDDGRVDGGLSATLKGGGTRAWLEDLVGAAVTPPLARFNVFEVLPDPALPPDEPSRILPGRAVYVLDVPSSPDAPHQAKDHRYYLRIAGKSRPMSHLHIEDVLRRNTTPRVALSRLGPYGDQEQDLSDPRGPRAFVVLRAFLHNSGRSMARHVGAELTLPRPFVGREVRRRMGDAGETHYTQRPGAVSFFRYHPTPLFPTQEVYGLCVWLSVHANNLAQLKAGAALSWAVYADDARPQLGAAPLMSFSSVRLAAEWVERQSPGGAVSP
jgi:hypothetical protein